MSSAQDQKVINITLIGAGTIGLSFAALHLTQNPNANLTIYDPRPDLDSHITTTLPTYLSSSSPSSSSSYTTRLKTSKTLQEAVQSADVIQEQGPENAPFKQHLWAQVEAHAPATALLWSSTSGIPASVQAQEMRDKTRLLVVHPYNPPHVMPLLEIVPSPSTAPGVLAHTVAYWEALGRKPIVLKKECVGFVANRLAFALLREAVGLVREGVIGVRELDELVTASMGPRWAVQGPFRAYHAGGGEAGLRGFLGNIGGTVEACWTAGEEVKVGPGGSQGWEGPICEESERVYGRVVDAGDTSRKTKLVLEAVGGGVGSKQNEQRTVEELEQEDR